MLQLFSLISNFIIHISSGCKTQETTCYTFSLEHPTTQVYFKRLHRYVSLKWIFVACWFGHQFTCPVSPIFYLSDIMPGLLTLVCCVRARQLICQSGIYRHGSFPTLPHFLPQHGAWWLCCACGGMNFILRSVAGGKVPPEVTQKHSFQKVLLCAAGHRKMQKEKEGLHCPVCQKVKVM